MLEMSGTEDDQSDRSQFVLSQEGQWVQRPIANGEQTSDAMSGATKGDEEAASNGDEEKGAEQQPSGPPTP